MIRRQETIHCIMRDSKILDALTWYWDTSEEDDVVKLATRWNRRTEKSLGGIVKVNIVVKLRKETKIS